MTYAALETTDSVALPGASLIQQLDHLAASLATGEQISLAPAEGSVRLRADTGTVAVDLVLGAELALRVGAHLAALAARELEPQLEEAAE